MQPYDIYIAKMGRLSRFLLERTCIALSDARGAAPQKSGTHRSLDTSYYPHQVVSQQHPPGIRLILFILLTRSLTGRSIQCIAYHPLLTPSPRKKYQSSIFPSPFASLSLASPKSVSIELGSRDTVSRWSLQRVERKYS